MSRATETRLGKLEVRAGVAGRRVFIFGALEPGKAKRRELIASGEARKTSWRLKASEFIASMEARLRQ
jgi:hypothetical protein